MGGKQENLSPAGWYDDPFGRAPLRFWTGEEWSPWTYDGTTLKADQDATRRRLGLRDFGHLDFVENVFLREARARGHLTPAQDRLLEGLLRELITEASGLHVPAAPAVGAATVTGAGATAVQAAPPTPAVAVGGPPGVAEAPVATGPGGLPVVPTAPEEPEEVAPPAQPKPPSALSLWWQRTREAVGSDLAVHGLAYSGVLLFFVGAFGLVVFAFGDVAPALRPVAEAVIALAPFGAGTLLRRRGATVVGRALEVAGGLVLPIMLITTLVDGVAVPPDPQGVALAATLTGLMALVTVAYAAWSGRHPESALRYLVAPVAWLTVAMATVGVGRPIPSGQGVATPSAAQTAAMAAALVLSVVWARLRPAARLSEPTRVVAVPGLAVVAVLGLLSWAAETWPVVPAVATGALVLTALELVSDRVSSVVIGILEPLWWGVVWAAVAAGADALGLSQAAVAAGAALGFLLVVEAAGRSDRSGPALWLPSVGLASALLTTPSGSWWAVGSLGLAAAWAAGRRLAPFGGWRGAVALDLATAVLPILALSAFTEVAGASPALLAASCLVLGAAVVARRRLFERPPEARFWTRWFAGGGLLVAVLAAPVWELRPEPGQRWFVVAALAVLAVAAALGPMLRGWRPLAVTGLVSATWLGGVGLFAVPDVVALTPLAAGGLVLVLVAHVVPARRLTAQASLGLAGHAVGVVAVLMGVPSEWSIVTTVGLATLGFGVTGWLGAQGHSAVTVVLNRQLRALGRLPLGLAAAGVVATTSLALDVADILPLDAPWAPVVPAAAAIAYAALTRLPVPRRVAATSAWAAYASGMLGALTALLGPENPPRIVALAVLVTGVAVVRGDQRAAVMTWTAWLALTPLTVVLADEYLPWFASLPADSAAAAALAVVGSALLAGAAAADLTGRSWTPRTAPSHPWAVAPAVLGAVHVAASSAVVASGLEGELPGWVLVVEACAVLATAVLARVGLLAGVATALAWWAAFLLAGTTIEGQPWIAVVAVLAVLVAAQGFSLRRGNGPWWERWDLPLLVAAAPIAITALVVAGPGSAGSLTFAAIGAECIAVAARLRRVPLAAPALGAVGAGLVIIGAGRAGDGWLALALLGLSGSLTALAVGARGLPRVLLQVGGALGAAASWRVASDWLGLSDQQAVELAALGAAVVVGAAALLARALVDRVWSLAWGGLAVAVEAACIWDVSSAQGLLRADVVATWPVVAGPAVTAAALALSAAALRLAWLRDLAMAYAIAALVLALQVADATVGAQVAALAIVSALAAALVLALDRGAPAWRRPVLLLGGAATAVAFVTALALADDPMLFVPVLAVAAAQAASAGTVLRQAWLQMAAPVLACAAWLVFALQALDGNPQWVTVPIGLTTLVVVALWRRDQHRRGRSIASPEIVVVELSGAALLVGAAYVQAVTDNLAYAAVAVGVGLGVMAWGAVTKVRRRLAVGAVEVLVAVALLVVVPLVRLLPSWEGAGLWVLIGGIGLVAVITATFIERGRVAVRKGLTRFSEATAGWE